MIDFSTKKVGPATRGASTWGGIQVGNEILMTRSLHVKTGVSEHSGVARETYHFECLTGDMVTGFAVAQDQTETAAARLTQHNKTNAPHKTGLTPEDALLVGLSATRMALRKTQLPFLRNDQIRAVLPQESADVLLERLEKPCFAFHAVPNPEGDGSQVFFAVCETHLLTDLLESLVGLQPLGVVVAELGAWSLLEQVGLVANQGSVLIVDATVDPPAIIHLLDGQLQALRLVAPATVAVGEVAVSEELQWLLASLWSQVIARSTINKQEDDLTKAAVDAGSEVIFLGRSQEFWQPFLANPPWKIASEKVSLQKTAAGCVLRIPTFQELGQGLLGWAWVRPAGLALAARQGQMRLLDFHGVGGFYGLMREWLAFWRLSGVLIVFLAMVWGSMEGLRYHLAQTRNKHFKSEIAALFKKALPRVPVMLDPRLQLRQALNQTDPEGAQTLKMVEWLRLIQLRVDAESEVQWLRFRYEPGEVQLLGEVPSYKHLDRVQTALKSIPLVGEVRTEEAHIVTKTNKVQFRLRLL